MNILDKLKGYKSLSIIGNYKNVGKTTTLNYIIEEAKGNLILGMTSIGVDGEEEDRVTTTAKPRVYVNKGTLIATAKNYALNSDITKEILEVTNINTPIGKVVIFRALSDGFIELAGPSINSQAKYICDRLYEFGADLTIVDGALSRKTMASPSITESSILCTGAVLSRSMDKVVEQTSHEFNMLTSDKLNDEKFYKLYEEKLTKDKISVVSKDYSYKILDSKTTLEAHKEIVDNIDDETLYVVFNGVVVNSLIENIIKATDKYKNCTFVLKDGSKIFLDKDVYDKFIKMGGVIKVVDKINLVGVSINPTSINGYCFDSNKFIDSMQKEIKVDVFNVFMKEGCAY